MQDRGEGMYLIRVPSFLLINPLTNSYLTLRLLVVIPVAE
jgi:hypothetical protein